ncbi:MAG: InlB B-repeat-containing protein [Clostridiales Family XIII bacterium]|jgi:uncharacterized repeat protein (TIGR02543 family)|nr:InlB B-repeat-containing protein [Clostridiales Family XIII bacterium]
MLQVLSAANEVLSNEQASQLIVDTATNSLNVAIANLIPKSQANATALYEAIKANENLDVSGRTVKSTNDFIDALEGAQDKLAALFDEEGNATAENTGSAQLAVDECVVALQSAADELFNKDYLAQYKAYYDNILVLDDLLPGKAAGYDSGSFSAFSNARAAAVSYAEDLGAFTTETVTRSVAYRAKTVHDAFWTSYYRGLKSKKGDITVHLRVADSIGASNPSQSIGATFDGDVGLTDDGHTVGDLVGALPDGYTVSREYYEIPMVYINGALVADPWMGYYDLNGSYHIHDWEGLVLRDGDEVVISRVEQPYGYYYGQYVQRAVVDTYDPYKEFVSMLRFKGADGAVEAEAGKAFTLDVEQTPAWLGSDGVWSPREDATILASAPAESREDAGAALTKTGTATDASGASSQTFYRAGWYRVAAYDTRASQTATITLSGADKDGSYPNLAVGAATWVHVSESSDPLAVKAELLEELDGAYGKYPEEMFRPAKWAELKSAYDEAAAALRGKDATVGDARDAQQEGIAAITAIQSAMLSENSAYLSDFRDKLGRLPDDVSLIDTSQKTLVEQLIARYDSFSEWQFGQITAKESVKYERVKAAYDGGLPGTTNSYSLSTEVRADSPEAQAVIEDMMQWLYDNPGVNDVISLSYGHNTERYGTFQDVTNAFVNGSGNKDRGVIADRQPDSTIYFFPSIAYSAYFQMRDSGDGTVSGGDWSISDEGMGFKDRPMAAGQGTTVDSMGSPKVTVLGKEYELKSVKLEGVAASKVKSSEHWVWDNSTYKGKPAQSNVYFEGAFQTFPMPYNDVKAVFTWGPADADDAIDVAKAAAKGDIGSAYDEYDLTLYDDGGKAALLKARDDGIEAVDAAMDKNAVADARKEAIAAMDAVQEKDIPSEPSVGKRVGKVRVTAENKTFAGGAFTGDIVPGVWFPLHEEDTVMSVILRALKSEGYGSTGSYAYLSGVTKDGRKLAEFDGGGGSGWMITLNDWFINEGGHMFGVKDGKLESGDEVKLLYTCNYGEDLESSWWSPDTSLTALEVDGGGLSPAFTSATKYIVNVTGSGPKLKITPTAANKNYQTRAYLNRANDASAFYKRNERVPVKPGDVVHVGVGDRAWPSMNNQGMDAISYKGTWYDLYVIGESGGANHAVSLIGDLPKDITDSDIGDVLFAKALYDALTGDEQTKVTNKDTLDAAVDAVGGADVLKAAKAAIAALPNASGLTDSTKEDARGLIEVAVSWCDALTDDQKDDLTLSELNRYTEAMAKLARLDGDETARKAPLVSKVGTAEGLKEAAYTDKSWAALTGAVSAAKAVLIRPDATQSEVNAAIATIDGAIAALKLKDTGINIPPGGDKPPVDDGKPPAAKSFTVSFDANGGKVSLKSKILNENAEYGALPKATRSGYKFLGWYTAQKGGKNVTTQTGLAKKADHTLYAHWKANKYKVTLDANGGKVKVKGKEVKTATITATFDKAYGKLQKATRTGGYKFKGWYTAKRGGVKATTKSIMDKAGAQTLYAQWDVRYGILNDDAFSVKVRSKAGMDGKVLGYVPVGMEYRVLKMVDRKGEGDDWYKVKCRNTQDKVVTGYVHARYMKSYWR